MHPAHPLQLFAIPADWSAEQAMAVVELLDELRERIWARYVLQFDVAYRAHYAPGPSAIPPALPADEDPF